MASALSSIKRTGSNSNASGGGLRSCVGCGGQIHDQYILRVAPNLEWHAACLKCCECQKFLDEKCTCFVREGKIFCKEDYVRLFGTKCDKCCRSFGPSDFVMRAKNKIFHLECFRCITCEKQLVPGDEFALRPDGLFCKEDHAGSWQSSFATATGGLEENNNHTEEDGGDLEDDDEQSQDGDKDLLLLEPRCSSHDRLADSGLDDLGSEKSPGSSIGGGSMSNREMVVSSSSMTSSSAETPSGSGLHGGHQQRKSRAGRVRTVLTEKQLSLLKSCYNANPRPDALMKEQMVEMTGLSPRVIRVWFQNKRCKDKKKHILQKSKEGRKLSYSSMSGIPMVATSPMRHELPPTTTPLNSVEIQGYEPPWKALCDFALNSDLDRPGYNHLVNEMHGYDFGGRPLPPPLANDLVPPYPPEPPYMDPGVAPSMDGYTLTSLDTSNES